MHRGMRALATLACVALLATACSGGGDEGSGGEAADPESVSGEVTFWDTSGENEQPVFQQLIEEFEKEHPNITVKHEPVPFGDAENKFKTAAQSGNAPDVLRSDIGWTPGFIELRYLEPLDDTPAVEGWDDFLASSKRAVEVNDHIYGVPQVTDAMALMYNKQLFEQAGIAEPPSTWDELAEVAATIKEKTGVTGFAINGNDPYHLLPYIYGNGGALVTDGEITVSSPETVEGIRTQLELATKPGITRDITQNAYANVNNAGFQEGKVAMVINGPWFLGDLESSGVFASNPERLGIASVPGSTEGSGQSPIGGHYYVVYAGSEVKPAAFEFIKFMSRPESQTLLATELGLFPTRESVYEDPTVAEDRYIQAFKPLIDAAHPRPPYPGDFMTPLKEQFAKEMAPDAVKAATEAVVPAFEELVGSGG